MNATTQLKNLSDKIADAIVDLVNDTDGPVTFPDVELAIPGFAKNEPPSWGYVIADSGRENLIWSGMSEAGKVALSKVISGRRVAIQFVNLLPYLRYMLDDWHVDDDDWLPSVLVPAKAANLEAPRRLIRASAGCQKYIIARAAADKTAGYRLLTPAPMRFTADQFAL
jgi:hypothetical protein